MATLTAEQVLRDYIESGTIPPKSTMKKVGSALVFACLERAMLMADDVKLHLLLEAACPAMPVFTEPELRRMLQLTTKLLGRIPPYGVALVLPYLDQSELTPGLSADIRDLEANLTQSTYFFSQAGDQLFRQRLGVLRWLDQWDEIDPDHCWSELIRHDLRGMPVENRKRWSRLFRSIRADGVSRLRPKAAEEARQWLDALGKEEFRLWLERWFYPFSQEKPLPLSVAGSHILKGLLLYCGLANHQAVNQAALWLLLASWKQKKNVDKVMVALLSVIESMPPQDAWQPLLRLQETWAVQGGQIESMLKQIAAALGISEDELRRRRLLKPEPPRLPDITLKARLVELDLIGPRFGAKHPSVDGDEALVEGSVDAYRVSLQTGRIVRQSDRAVLILDPMRLPADLQPFVDVQIQLEADPARIAAREMVHRDDEPIPLTANLRQVYLRIAMLKEDELYGAAFVSLSEPIAS